MLFVSQDFLRGENSIVRGLGNSAKRMVVVHEAIVVAVAIVFPSSRIY